MLTGQSKSSQSFQFGPNTSIVSSLVPLKSSGELMIIHAMAIPPALMAARFFPDKSAVPFDTCCGESFHVAAPRSG